MKRILLPIACLAFAAACHSPNAPVTSPADSTVAKHDTAAAPPDNTKTVPPPPQVGPPPAVTNSPVTTGMYKSLVKSHSIVLADFSAEWCGPCKILAPRLEALEKEMPGQFTLYRLDSDRDMVLADSMNITALPTLLLYKDGKLVWRNEGLVPKELVASKIKDAQAMK